VTEALQKGIIEFQQARDIVVGMYRDMADYEQIVFANAWRLAKNKFGKGNKPVKESKGGTPEELRQIAMLSGEVQTKRLASLMRTAYLDDGISDKEVILEKVKASLSQLQPPCEVSRQKLTAAYAMAVGQSNDGHDKIIHDGDKTVRNGSEINQKLTPKELDAFITGLLKDGTEEMTWSRLVKLTKAYKKDAGVALLNMVLSKITKMMRDGLSEKLMLPELEGAYGTNFKLFLGALRAHINERGRLSAGWKTRILNTNLTEGMEKPPVPTEKKGRYGPGKATK
jgi:hypothetical protein